MDVCAALTSLDEAEARKQREIDAAWAQHKAQNRSPWFWARIAMRRRLAEAQNWRCCYCGCVTTDEAGRDSSPRQATLEHIVPRALGGPDHESNLVIACAACNGRRGTEWWPVHAEATGLTCFAVKPAP